MVGPLFLGRSLLKKKPQRSLVAGLSWCDLKSDLLEDLIHLLADIVLRLAQLLLQVPYQLLAIALGLLNVVFREVTVGFAKLTFQRRLSGNDPARNV